MTPDPRLNAPPRLSDLHGERRLDALYARHNASTAAYMATWTEPVVRRSWVGRVMAALRDLAGVA